MSKYITCIKVTFVIILLVFTSSNSFTQSRNNKVVPIDKSRFGKTELTDSTLIQWKTLLVLSCDEILNEWWMTIPDLKDNKQGADNNSLIDFGYLENNSKTGEFGKESKGGIRDAAEASYTLAVLIFTGALDTSLIDIPEATIIQRTRQLIKSLAKDHRVNGGINHPWGNQWQSAQWASKVAVAGWLMWEYLEEEDKNNISRMIEYEANRFLNKVAPSANENYKVNTQAEEDGWDGTGIQTACAMLPNHENYNAWMAKSLEYRFTALAMPTDLKNESVVDGKMIKDWISGYNIDTLGALGNHKAYPHPDYMTASLRHTTEGALFLKLGNQPIPVANTFNCFMIYKNFNEHVWNGESTIYKKDGNIYWPINIENKRRFKFIKYSFIDLGAQVLDFDKASSIKGEYWEKKHLAKAIETNQRSYLSASGYLLKWIQNTCKDN